MFSIADHPIREFMRPINRFQMRRVDPSTEQIAQFARRQRVGLVVILSSSGQLQYIKVIELLVERQTGAIDSEPVIDVHDSDQHGIILVRMQTEKIPIARVCLLYTSDAADE